MHENTMNLERNGLIVVSRWSQLCKKVHAIEHHEHVMQCINRPSGRYVIFCKPVMLLPTCSDAAWLGDLFCCGTLECLGPGASSMLANCPVGRVGGGALQGVCSSACSGTGGLGGRTSSLQWRCRWCVNVGA